MIASDLREYAERCLADERVAARRLRMARRSESPAWLLDRLWWAYDAAMGELLAANAQADAARASEPAEATALLVLACREVA